MFNSLDDKTWINLISKLYSLEFELVKVETLEYSANSVVQDTRKVGLKTDFIITFVKQPHINKPDLNILALERDHQEIKNSISLLFNSENNQGFETYQILNHLFRHFLHQNKFFKVSEVLNLLSENYSYRQNKWKQK
jgi:hypothetical protein